jgi:UDPglucose 6-dehydrogenase
VNIGIIGQGFVGSAMLDGLQKFYNVLTYDIDISKCNSTHDKVCKTSDIIFICVPTPMRMSGECDTRILEYAVEKINAVFANEHNYKNRQRPILVIKSTIPPGTSKRINDEIAPLLNICFSPEFLTEANSFDDFKNQSRIIVGGNPTTDCLGAKKVKQMFRKPFPDIPIIVTKRETAEMVKYFTNCFLATKVTFANQMYEICEAAGIDYDKVCEYILYDKRIGKSHLAVPGPDGDRGFGGHCFPKDLSAMIRFAELNSVSEFFLKAVNIANHDYRTDKDWEKMKGRAVSED